MDKESDALVGLRTKVSDLIFAVQQINAGNVPVAAHQGEVTVPQGAASNESLRGFWARLFRRNG